MKINELISSFTVQITNEEEALLEKIQGPSYLEMFNERERFVIENLIRKNLVSKIKRNSTYMVMKNG